MAPLKCKLHPEYEGKKRPTDIKSGCVCKLIYKIRQEVESRKRFD